MFSYSTGYYVSPPVDQYLKFKNRCSLRVILPAHLTTLAGVIDSLESIPGLLQRLQIWALVPIHNITAKNKKRKIWLLDVCTVYTHIL